MSQRRNRRYTKEERDFIRKNYKKHTIEELAVTLGRTKKAIRGQIERMKLPLATLERNQGFNWTSKKIGFLKKHYRKYSDEKIGEIIGASQSIVLRKRLELGLNIITRKPYIQSGYYRQYVNGKRVWMHRHEAEKKMGRKLAQNEPVHHIDGNKLNNAHENLYVCKSRAAHGTVHNSLEEVAFSLFRIGVIKFNESKGEYYHTCQSDTEG
jgi:hypothetical protein